MKKLLSILLLLPFLIKAQTTTVYTQQDTSGVDINRSFTGLIDYYNIPQRTDGKSPIPYPNPAGGIQHAQDAYFRITADEISKGFSGFDSYFNNAIDRGQEIGFRLVTIDDSYGGNTVSGNKMAYPIAWHNSMQGEANPDFMIGNVWWPNYNSTSYKSQWSLLCVSVRDHINNTTHNGVKYSDVFTYMDISGIGIYGEGHRFLNIGSGWTWPTGTQWTLVSLEQIVQSQIDNFPNVPLIGNINYLNSNSELPAGFDTYYMNGSSTWGFFGLRWDHACDAGDFNFDYTSKPAATKAWITAVYQNAPVLAEPQQFNFAVAGQCDYSHVMTEIMTYHASTIENTDSYENGATLPSCTQSLLYSIAKALGYRYTITQSTTSDSLIANGAFFVTGNYKNEGIAPNYEDYDTWYELRQGAAVMWSSKSSLLFKYFQPGVNNHTDNYTLTNLAAGSYDLYLIVRSKKLRKPLYMQITGRQTDGSYLLRSGIHTATQGTPPPPPPPPPPNNPPFVFAGNVQTDTLPKNVDTLQGIASDPDGDPVTLIWTQTAGPNTATMVSPTALLNRITGLIEGQYTFRLTGNDGRGGISTSDANVTVVDTSHAVPPPPPPPPPTYRPPVTTIDTTGSHIQLPKDSVTLVGHVTRKDTAIQSVQWSLINTNGMTQGTIVTATDSTTKVRGLSAAGNQISFYLFKFTVTDKAGNSVDQFIYVYVAPVIIPDPPPLPPVPGPVKYLGIKKAF